VGPTENVRALSPVLFIFVDGLGIGSRGAQNPLDQANIDLLPLAVFRDEPHVAVHNGMMVPTDASLGIEGRPQSASGQSTILTGINVPQRLGYHKQGFPNQAMREIIAEHSIFLQLQRQGFGPNNFANTYTPKFFVERPRWISATTCAVEAAGMRFNQLEDLAAGRSLFHDYTNAQLVERGVSVEIRSPEQAGEILVQAASDHAFTLYEYFLTDTAGHKQDRGRATEILAGLAALVRTVLERSDLAKMTVILTSDHGNVEDLSSRNHTLNQVPTFVWGAGRDFFAGRIRNLADITPAIVDWFAQT
jgi:2,3-bisphosphoglycerate-independent phosphoglycerate mutase